MIYVWQEKDGRQKTIDGGHFINTSFLPFWVDINGLFEKSPATNGQAFVIQPRVKNNLFTCNCRTICNGSFFIFISLWRFAIGRVCAAN